MSVYQDVTDIIADHGSLWENVLVGAGSDAFEGLILPSEFEGAWSAFVRAVRGLDAAYEHLPGAHDPPVYAPPPVDFGTINIPRVFFTSSWSAPLASPPTDDYNT